MQLSKHNFSLAAGLTLIVIATAITASIASTDRAQSDANPNNSRAYLHSYNLDSTGLAIEGYCPVSYFTQRKAVMGNPGHTSTYNGVDYRFASRSAKRAFDQNPERYTPAYGGWCAYGMAIENKFPIDPTNFKIVDGRLLRLPAQHATSTRVERWNQNDESRARSQRADRLLEDRSPADPKTTQPLSPPGRRVRTRPAGRFHRAQHQPRHQGATPCPRPPTSSPPFTAQNLHAPRCRRARTPGTARDPEACLARLHRPTRGGETATSSSRGANRHRAPSSPAKWAERARLPAYEGTLGVHRQPHQRPLRVRVARRRTATGSARTATSTGSSTTTGLMRRRDMSANDVTIQEADRRYTA